MWDLVGAVTAALLGFGVLVIVEAVRQAAVQELEVNPPHGGEYVRCICPTHRPVRMKKARRAA